MKDQDNELENLLKEIYLESQTKIPEDVFVEKVINSIPEKRKFSWFRFLFAISFYSNHAINFY